MYIKPCIKDILRIGGQQGRYGFLRLDMNENPGGLPLDFVEEVKKELTPEYLAMYPEESRMKKLLADYPFELRQESENLMLMPCAAYMAKTEAGWNLNFLTEAEDKPVPEGITMEIEKQKKDEIIAVFHNRSGEEWGFGHAFSLQVLLDGQWYYVPAEDGNYAFTEELLVVPNGESRQETYHLEVYGTLFPGIYRIVSTEGLWVEFEIM